MKNIEVKVAISHGDVNGIGYEIIIKSLLDNRINELCVPIVYGSAKVAAYHRKVLDINNFSFNTIRTIDELNPKRSNLLSVVDDAVRVELGKSTEAGGLAAYEALEAATQAVIEGDADVLVTAPISKANIQSEAFSFPGHTEYLAVKTGVAPEDALMLMIGEQMKIGVVTGHIPLKDVPQTISLELILHKLRIMEQSMRYDFGIRKPRIAILGLNPHAGDAGLLGNEEQDIIIPAIEIANEENIMAMGPYPADGFFASGQYKNFDAILAMYHDQGLIPFKALEMERGVNFTAGLPIVRTSPAHGTAFEIAGQNLASFESFQQAMFWAVDIFRNRSEYDELVENQLQAQVHQE